MFKKIDKYIIRKFLTTFVFALLLIILIVIIFDISEKIDKFVANEAPLKAIVFDYYLNFIPYFANMFSPLFVFITVIFFTSKMAQNSEIVAILSCGISYHRMMVPYMFSATLIAAVSLVLNLYVIPDSNKTRLDFENQYVKTRFKSVGRNVHYQIAPGEFVYVESFASWNNTAYRFTLENVKDNKLVSKISAESAVYDKDTEKWKLKKYVIRTYNDDLTDKIRTGAQLDTVLNLTVNDFYRLNKTIETYNYDELEKCIEMQKLRGDADVKYSLIEKHNRFSMPFSAFILTIMGVSLSSRKKRGGIGWNIGIGIGLAFTYILFQRFSQMFVFTDTLPPGIAIWLPNILYAVVTAFLYSKAQK
ncbi:MAG: LptF/LptG family permease [Candidatus Cryptobacteroides sp.]